MNEIKLIKDKKVFYILFSIFFIALTVRLGYFFSGNQRAVSNLFFILSFPVILFVFNREIKISINNSMVFITFMIVFLFFWNVNLQYLYSYPESSYYKNNPFLFNAKVLNNFIYILSVYFSFSLFFKNITNYKKLWGIFRLSILPCLTLLSVEFYVRIFNPTLLNLNDFILNKVKNSNIENLGVDNFYSFKFASIMFGDSNFIPLFLMPLFVLFLIKKNKDKYDFIILFLISFFVVFSFSRAGIASLIVVVVVVSYLSTKKTVNLVFKSIFYFIVCLFVFISVYSIVLHDASFITKIKIFDDLSTVFNKSITVALFGFGPGVGGFEYSYEVGLYAHTLLAILLGEVGIIGIIIYLSIYLFIVLKNKYNIVFMIPLFTLGLSYYEPWEALNVLSIMYFNYLYFNKDTIFN